MKIASTAQYHSFACGILIWDPRHPLKSLQWLAFGPAGEHNQLMPTWNSRSEPIRTTERPADWAEFEPTDWAVALTVSAPIQNFYAHPDGRFAMYTEEGLLRRWWIWPSRAAHDHYVRSIPNRDVEDPKGRYFPSDSARLERYGRDPQSGRINLPEIEVDSVPGF